MLRFSPFLLLVLASCSPAPDPPRWPPRVPVTEGPGPDPRFGQTERGEAARFERDRVRLVPGRLLLVRRRGEYGAIRITDVVPLPGGEVHGYARYQTFFPGREGSFRRPRVDREGELADLPNRGIGHPIPHPPGNRIVWCGPWGFAYSHPGWISMRLHGDPKNLEFFFAPTPWSDVSEVRAEHPRLKWHGVNEGRASMEFPLWRSLE